MRTTSAVLRLAVCLSSLAPLASAWPSWLPERDAIIVARQNDEESTSAARATDTITSEASAETGTTSDEPRTTTTGRRSQIDLNTAEPSTSGGTRTGTRTKGDDPPERTTFAFDDPAGGVSMLDPNTMIVPTPLYKIGDNVTMQWNYTSLQGDPTAIDVLLSCSVASETWTIAANMSFETSVDFYWDTREQQRDVEAPLPEALYTLIIKDSDAEITETPDPGYLGAYSGFKFGMYHAAEYTKYSDWKCTACSAAGRVGPSSIGSALAMAIFTSISFTWYAVGL